MGAIVVEVILGYLTFTGSLIAAAKLQEVKWIPQRPWVYKGQNYVNLIAFGVAIVLVEQKLAIPLEISNRLYVMDHGAVAWGGTTDDFRADRANIERRMTV